jgi:hypothetical protein
VKAKRVVAMAYVYDFIVLLLWTGICAALVYGLERILEGFGYKPTPLTSDETHVPPLPPG